MVVVGRVSANESFFLFRSWLWEVSVSCCDLLEGSSVHKLGQSGVVAALVGERIAESLGLAMGGAELVAFVPEFESVPVDWRLAGAGAGARD